MALLRKARVANVSADAWKAAASRMAAWFQGALKQQPQSVALRLQFADLHKMLDRPQEAEKLYRAVLQQEPRQVVALNNLAWLLAEQNVKSDEALSLIDRVIEYYGPRPEFLDTRTVVLLNLGRHEAAVADLTRTIEDAPSFTKYLHLTDAHRQASNRTAARAALNRARSLNPGPGRLSPAELTLLQRLEKDLQ